MGGREDAATLEELDVAQIRIPNEIEDSVAIERDRRGDHRAAAERDGPAAHAGIDRERILEGG